MARNNRSYLGTTTALNDRAAQFQGPLQILDENGQRIRLQTAEMDNPPQHEHSVHAAQGRAVRPAAALSRANGDVSGGLHHSVFSLRAREDARARSHNGR